MYNSNFFKDTMDYKMLTKEILKIKEFKQLATVFSIGKSWQGKELYCVRIGTGMTSVIYVGAHHALEWGTSSMLMCFINEFLSSAKKKSKLLGYDCDLFLKNISLYIIPMLNPDGVDLVINGIDKNMPFYDRLIKFNDNSEIFDSWQANIRGVDLNHNYNAGFDKAKQLEIGMNITGPSKTRYSGEHFESELETKALCRFTKSVNPSLVLALHSQGKEIYYDYENKASTICENIAIIISKLTGYSVEKTEGISSYGGYKDWFIEHFGGVGITIEVGRGENPLNTLQIIEGYNDIREALICTPLLLK